MTQQLEISDTEAWLLQLIPEAHIQVEGGNPLHRIVLEPPHDWLSWRAHNADPTQE